MLAQASHPPFTGLSVSALPPGRRHLAVHAVDDEERAQVERFIHDVYRERYGAHVQHFAPTLISLRDEAGEVKAAAQS